MGIPELMPIMSLVGFFLAMSVHEFSHALAAYNQGDRTAEQAGRLTLNPLAHIDLFGTVLLPLFLILTNSGIVFGWAKPVPVNYFALRDPKWGPAIVSLAGPAANLIFGFFSLVCYAMVNRFMHLPAGNLVPLFLQLLALINFGLMIFNLIPIPPLDGSKILYTLLPSKYDNFKIMLDQYGMILLFVLLFIGVDFVFYLAQIIFIFSLNLLSYLV